MKAKHNKVKITKKGDEYHISGILTIPAVGEHIQDTNFVICKADKSYKKGQKIKLYIGKDETTA